jgi:predicted small metal-binding protein
MTKVLRCSDIKPGCDFEIRGNSEEEVMKQATAHAKTAHNIQDITPELASKVRSAIHEESQAKGHSSGSN